jgi:hypothetical protein
MASGGSHSSPEGVRDHDRCPHAGYYSGVGIYMKHSRMLRYVLVCDDCGEEMKEISALEYAPDPVFAIA